MMLVTLAQARDHIRSDTDADDADLKLKIEGASAAVVDYLGSFLPLDSAGDPLEDSQGDLVGVKPRAMQRIRNAVLITVAYMYRERDGSQEYAVPTQWGYGYALPQGATALLYSLRKPTVA
ncbi:head-tail connector protein [Delftia tsuruhatensis]|uniref:Phage gp6-like head-tail connector protein n=1 Tax=Delftia tsuruhatensis TaxID=180282 RepID=A0ABM6E4H6_9BURK|nr:head-tail connector protein [Delftia tsuruhatensis]AOV02391.1 hypothetical protein BI380_14120 [Delftia tsuruhatensis]